MRKKNLVRFENTVILWKELGEIWNHSDFVKRTGWYLKWPLWRVVEKNWVLKLQQYWPVQNWFRQQGVCNNICKIRSKKKKTDFLKMLTTTTSRWGEDGYIRLARGDQCGTDSKPLDGTGCVNGPGSDVRWWWWFEKCSGPGSDVRYWGWFEKLVHHCLYQVQHVCGQCGVLFDTSYPLGAKLAWTGTSVSS